MPSPRTRGWIHNLRANPTLTFHLKKGPQADLPATARVIDDLAERWSILEHVARTWRRTDVAEMVHNSPLIEVTIPGFAPTFSAAA